MKKDRALVIFRCTKRNLSVDLDIPLSITANDLVIALNEAYHLGMNLSDERERYLTAEHPIALLRGEKTLAEYGIHHGTTILFTRG